MSGYQIMGRPIAGSFFAECMLTEAGADYEFVHISNTFSKTDEFAAINPLKRIPVLVCPDGHRIIETLAIANHLIEQFPQLAPPVGDARRDAMWEHLSVLATSLYPAMHRYHHTYYYAPDEMHDAVREMAGIDAARWWDYFEGQLAPYLAGEKPMVADFYLLMITGWTTNLDEVLETRPKLRAFIAAMSDHAAVKAVRASHAK